jgi:transcriptional regulator with XRE-family HTH domain
MKDWGITIGARIKSRREEIGLPVPTLARAVGLAQSTVYDLMRSDSTSSTKLHLFAKVLGLNVDWLETGKGPRLVAGAGQAPIKEGAAPAYAPITPKEAEIGREWGRLREPQRSVVAAQIQLLLKAQEREDSGRKRHRTTSGPVAAE